MITCARNVLGMWEGKRLQTIMQVWHLQKGRRKIEEWVKKKNSDSRNQVSRKFWLMQLLLPESVLGGVHILPKWACLIALPHSVMAWDLPGECVPTMWRQPGTRRGTGGVSKLCAPHRRLEQHTVIFTRSEKLLITYCFKMLSITCQAYLIVCSFANSL